MSLQMLGAQLYSIRQDAAGAMQVPSMEGLDNFQPFGLLQDCLKRTQLYSSFLQSGGKDVHMGNCCCSFKGEGTQVV